MTLPTIIIAALLVIFYFWYAAIIVRKNRVSEALSGIDVQLKKRSEVIPNILTIAKKFMEHEEKIFTQITALREKLQSDYNKNDLAQVKNHLTLSEELSQSMNSFMARAESYPELKSSQNMLQAQQTYNEIEEQISAARRFYNSAVAELRNSIQIFPGNLLASIAGAQDMPLYEAEESSKAPVSAQNFLS